MQIHYNLLRGDKPVRAKLKLHTVPASTPLKPLNLDLMPAPPDVPCPAGVTGPLCRPVRLAGQSRTAVRRQRRRVRRPPRDVLRPQSGQSAGRRHHLVHLAGRTPGGPSSASASTCTCWDGG